MTDLVRPITTPPPDWWPAWEEYRDSVVVLTPEGAFAAGWRARQWEIDATKEVAYEAGFRAGERKGGLSGPGQGDDSLTK